MLLFKRKKQYGVSLFSMRKVFVIFWLACLFMGISSFFWYNEWKYSLPTPVPANYKDVKQGDYVDLAGKVKSENNKPVFIHFFNPDCPCSRFNIPHFKSLVKQYGDKVNFAIVVMTKDNDYTVEKIQDKFDLKVPVLFDKSIATSCGVYSTPQAALLTADNKLYYRGNYNKSRYCTDKKSDYAQMAIDSLLNHTANPAFDHHALTAYGCALLRNCTKPTK